MRYDSMYPRGFEVAAFALLCCASFPFLAGDKGDEMDENSVTDGEGLPQPKREAKGEAGGPGDFGSGLSRLLADCGLSEGDSC